MNDIELPVEQILVRLARTYAPHLLSAKSLRPGDLKKPIHVLARELATYDVLVLLAKRGLADTQASVPRLVQECHNLYFSMYRLLVGVSFPTRVNVKSFYFHGRQLLMIVFEGEARHVIELLAGYVSPYVAERQGIYPLPNLEIQNMVDHIIKKLNLPKLTREHAQLLRTDGVQIMCRMLTMPLQQLPLTLFDEPFDDIVQSTRPAKPPPDVLPYESLQPFVDEVALSSNGKEPEFIQNLRREASQPLAEDLQPNLDNVGNRPPGAETGQLRPPEDYIRFIQPPVPGSDLPLPPLPNPLSDRPQDDSPFDVQFSANHPESLAPNEWYFLYAYVFRKNVSDAVSTDIARLQDKRETDFSRSIQRAHKSITYGAEIIARPTIAGFQFQPPYLPITFYGDWQRFEFKVRAHDAILDKHAVGSITFTVKGIIVAEVPLSIYVG